MQETSIDLMIASLKNVIEHGQEIEKSLKADTDFFVKNDIQAMEKSNQEKMALIENLNTLLNNLNHQHQPFGFLQKIEELKNNGNVKAQQELTRVYSELKTVVSNCYSHIVVNNQIVYANMNRLKNIWDEVMALRVPLDSVYDHNGSTVK